MNFFRFVYLLEVFSIAVGIAFLIVVVPLQCFVSQEIRTFSLISGSILWYTILFHNNTFWILVDKWFKR